MTKPIYLAALLVAVAGCGGSEEPEVVYGNLTIEDLTFESNTIELPKFYVGDYAFIASAEQPVRIVDIDINLLDKPPHWQYLYELPTAEFQEGDPTGGRFDGAIDESNLEKGLDAEFKFAEELATIHEAAADAKGGGE